jgi:hypothetical protein
MEPEETAVARERLCDMPVAKQWLCERHVIAAMPTYASVEELFEAVSSILSVATATSHYTKAFAGRVVFFVGL